RRAVQRHARDFALCKRRQAEAAGHEMIHEVLLLTTHGILHLLGFDHVEPEEEKEMFGIQKSVLESFYESEKV
ncbi:MAG: rRNA maturation RNase YbeY, partial [Micrococcales bacterium]|nr:rRNA maturation RNase YbeY [Micrococcales bacterium]